jgi:hypothetical protein
MTPTPGPWEWWTSNSWFRLRHSDRGVSTDVLMPVVLKDGQATIDVSPADMALIEAAPEMLAALELCVWLLDDIQSVPGLVQRKARAVIAKAKGLAQ